MEIKAVIFDCDGTLFNTEAVARDCYGIISDKYGLTLPDDFFIKVTGVTRESITAYLQKEADGFDRYYDEVRTLIVKMIKESCRQTDSLTKKGLYEIMDYLDTHGYKKAIASSSPILHIQGLLDHLHKHYHFDAITTGPEVKNSKPAPDIFLVTCERMGLRPEECLVIEDSINGIKAAKRAKTPNIFIKDLVPFSEDDYRYVDCELNDLGEIVNYLKHR